MRSNKNVKIGKSNLVAPTTSRKSRSYKSPLDKLTASSPPIPYLSSSVMLEVENIPEGSHFKLRDEGELLFAF